MFRAAPARSAETRAAQVLARVQENAGGETNGETN
jgi:hypothetical protein